ncbi:MAG: transcriptional regulator NrdR [candidate division SR1 bacterium CG_4_9_14_3_um_filter_40_9]|nr:MAG: transcriptional regulator NrdR [candidate division SR1 bacterium CG_4_9_14_3_um_filter_40_9]
MKCPKCQSMETKVIDSRVIEDGQSIRRRRECEFCNNRFTTFERKGFTELMVIKKDGSKEMYDREKLKRALMLACVKREMDKEEIENIINNLEAERSTDKNEISSKQIGDDILKALKNIDPVAYVRFASVYKSFDNLEDFKKYVE